MAPYSSKEIWWFAEEGKLPSTYTESFPTRVGPPFVPFLPGTVPFLKSPDIPSTFFGTSRCPDIWFGRFFILITAVMIFVGIQHRWFASQCSLYLVSYCIGVGRDSAVGVVTGYGLNGPGIESRWGRDFPHSSTLFLGTLPAFCTVGTGSFPGSKVAGAWLWPPTPI